MSQALGILHVMDHSVPRSDGYSIRAKYLLEAQAAAGHRVTVLTSPSQGDDAPELETGAIRYRRSDYTRFEKELVARGAKHLVFGRAISRRLAATLDAERFDVVHAHTPFTVARVALSEARRRGLPLVYEKRNLWEESARARGKASGHWPWFQAARAMDRWVTLRADAVCTITEALRKATVELGASPDRVVVVGNGADTDAFVPRPPPPALRARCLRGGEFVIGFLGSFFSFEGLPLLVDAFADLRDRYPGSRLLLIGEGEDRAKVEAAVARLGLAGAVSVPGPVPHAEVLDYYASMDVLVYPRYASPLTDMISPLKPLEPMAMERAVVGSSVGGLRELIEDNETGLIFEAGSKRSLSEKLALLLSRRVDAAALGRRARAFVVQRRQWRHMAARYQDAYRAAGVCGA
jgi:PEP-CTERM/exosortase A-associated glycosyltransferase